MSDMMDKARAWDAIGDKNLVILKLRTALEQIAAIKNKDFGPDWEEIEEARKIANDVLAGVVSSTGVSNG